MNRRGFFGRVLAGLAALVAAPFVKAQVETRLPELIWFRAHRVKGHREGLAELCYRDSAGENRVTRQIVTAESPYLEMDEGWQIGLQDSFFDDAGLDDSTAGITLVDDFGNQPSLGWYDAAL